MNDVPVTKVLSLRDHGNEFWLRDKIFDDPSILNLGDDLWPVVKEKPQIAGGGLIFCSRTRLVIRFTRSSCNLAKRTLRT
jgi:hypothetical protein